LSAGAVLTALGWASLLMVAVPLLVLHALLMAAWLLRRQPAGAGGRPSPR
ncbi:MAG TPA: MFS transporter, partial [Marinobacter sp.]|nr:MFS transporter [Marinobacter sp.]